MFFFAFVLAPIASTLALPAGHHTGTSSGVQHDGIHEQGSGQYSHQFGHAADHPMLHTLPWHVPLPVDANAHPESSSHQPPKELDLLSVLESTKEKMARVRQQKLDHVERKKLGTVGQLKRGKAPAILNPNDEDYEFKLWKQLYDRERRKGGVRSAQRRKQNGSPRSSTASTTLSSSERARDPATGRFSASSHSPLPVVHKWPKKQTKPRSLWNPARLARTRENDKISKRRRRALHKFKAVQVAGATEEQA